MLLATKWLGLSVSLEMYGPLVGWFHRPVQLLFWSLMGHLPFCVVILYVAVCSSAPSDTV